MKGCRLVFVVLCCVVAGCTADPRESQAVGALGSDCVWIAGHWTWTGCQETECYFWQDHCQIHLRCTSPDNEVYGHGSIAGSTLSFDSFCTATISGTSLQGTCTQPQACTFSALHP